MNRRRWLVRLGLLAVVGVGMLAWSLSQHAQARIVIENRSEQPIKQLSVTVDGQTRTFNNVPPGGELTAPLGDVPAVVEGHLADGSIIRQNFVQVMSGTLVILPGGNTLFRPSGKN